MAKAWHGPAWHSDVWRGVSRYCMAWHGLQKIADRYNAVWNRMAWHIEVWYGMVWNGMARAPGVCCGAVQKIAENPVAAPWSLRHVDQSKITAHSVLSCFGRLARNRERGCVHLDRPHLMTRHGMLAYCGRPTPDKTTLGAGWHGARPLAL